LATCGASLLALEAPKDGATEKKTTPQPVPLDPLKEAQAKARIAVDKYIQESSNDPQKQEEVAHYYCSPFDKLPVENSQLVQNEYATAENCTSLGVSLFRKLAENNNIEAQYQLATLFNSKLSKMLSMVRPNDDEAFKWYKLIADNAPASLKTPGFLPSSYKAVAALWLWTFYKEGLSVEKNLPAAFHWLQVSASISNDKNALIPLADMLAKGEGTKVDPIAAEAILKSLADSDDAQFKLGEVFLFNDLTTSDRFDKAKHIFEILHAEARGRLQRHESAYYLGILSLQGEANKKDYRSAFAYLLEAARFGEPQAQALVGSLYLSGLGAIQSYKNAYVWSSIAAANGNSSATNTRQQAEAHLSPAELEASRKEAGAWGTGSNAVTYECRAGGEGALTEKFTINLDNLSARWQYVDTSTLDVVEDGDKLIVRPDFHNEDYSIDRKSGAYEIRDNGRTQTGTCNRV
jgi:TPR repeat protein